jgi:UDP-glucose 4-epimerase
MFAHAGAIASTWLAGLQRTRWCDVRLFVTGGAGYVGSVVVEILAERGHEVVVYDDLSTGHRAAVHPAARLVVGSLQDGEALLRALPPATEAVLHFAAKSLVQDSLRDPIGYYEHNVGGAACLLRAMQARDVRKLVFSSSAGVYGEPGDAPISESVPPHPTHAYGGSKRAVEMLLEDAMRGGPLRAVFLRYFNAAGASLSRGEDHEPETHLVPNLLRAALGRREPVRVYGDDYATPDGTCVRDYVHVLDLAEAHATALEALDDGVSGPVNLGSGRGQSVREMLDAARQVTGFDIPATVEKRRPGDPARLVADISRAKRELGWVPRRSSPAEILRAAWQWLQAHPRGYDDRGR